MDFLSKELVTLDYRASLQRDMAQASVCRFLVAYVSLAGVDSINRPLLVRVLRDPRSFGVASLSCACKYEPLLKLQDELDDARLKYFMDPVVAEAGEPSDIALFHSKLVYLYLEKFNKSVVYLGSHNWTRRALGPQGPRNAEASLRMEFDFEDEHLAGKGSSIASEVNHHLLTAWQAPLCLPATRLNEPTFEEWSDKACRRAASVPMESNIILLAVRDGVGPVDWLSLNRRSVYLQVLDEDDGPLIWEKANNRLLVLVWDSEDDLNAARQPILLKCQISSSIAGSNSGVGGTNQSGSPIAGFNAVILDDQELAGLLEKRLERRPSVTLSSGRRVQVYGFEFPTHHVDCGTVDRGIEPNYRFLLEVEAVVMPTDRSLNQNVELAWSPDSFTVAKHKKATRVEHSPGYCVAPEVEHEMLGYLRETLLINPPQAKVLPYSGADGAKYGKRVSSHPLHETFLGTQLADSSLRDEYYRESKRGTLLADLDEINEVVDNDDSLPRLQRVFTSPVKKLLEDWRERASALRRANEPRAESDE